MGLINRNFKDTAHVSEGKRKKIKNQGTSGPTNDCARIQQRVIILIVYQGKVYGSVGRVFV